MTRLDTRLVAKVAAQREQPKKYILEQISKRANRLGISSEAALVLWAKELGFGTANYQRGLPTHVQQEIRDLLPSVFARPVSVPKRKISGRRQAPRQKDATAAAIEYLLNDNELRNRCTDLLKAKGNFDRVFREATTVLEHRIRKLAGVTDKKVRSADLAARALHPKGAILRISPDDDEQMGFFFVCNGLFLAFRNPTHHQLSDRFSRGSALQFCGFVDSLLSMLRQADKIGP